MSSCAEIDVESVAIGKILCPFSWCTAMTVSDFQQCLRCWPWWSLAWTSVSFPCGAGTFVCLYQLWKCPSCGWACTWAGYHSVVHHAVQVICCMPPSLLLTDWSPRDGSTATHWCDPNSLEVKANLSAGFPGLWANILLQFFWVTNEVSVWNHWGCFARDWVVPLSSVCAISSFDNCERCIYSTDGLFWKKEGILTNVLNFLLLFIYKEMDSDFKWVKIISFSLHFSYCNSKDSFKIPVIDTLKSLSMHPSTCEVRAAICLIWLDYCMQRLFSSE